MNLHDNMKGLLNLFESQHPVVKRVDEEGGEKSLQQGSKEVRDILYQHGKLLET
jgi:hypothetical protein